MGVVANQERLLLARTVYEKQSKIFFEIAQWPFQPTGKIFFVQEHIFP